MEPHAPGGRTARPLGRCQLKPSPAAMRAVVMRVIVTRMGKARAAFRPAAATRDPAKQPNRRHS